MLVRCAAMMRGGGETRHLAWIRELSGLGVDVDVITGQPFVFGAARHPLDDEVSVPVTTLRTPYLRDLVYQWQKTRGFGRVTSMALHLDEEWFCREAWRHVAARPLPPDVVHAHALHQTARLRRGNVPVVVNLPGPPHARYTADLASADALVADGWAADHLPRTLGRAIERVPKGVDTVRFSPDGADLRASLGLDGRPVIVAVGRLVPIKNLRLLIEALPLVQQAIPRVAAIIAGDGPDESMLRRLAVSLGVGEAVRFAGYVPHDDLAAYYRTADVFALTSTFDNSPNVVLEAMASARPVVCTDVGGVSEFVEPSGGQLVPANDPAALAAALVSWLESGPRREQAGRHNRQVVLERYSWNASARRLLAVYEQVIAARAGRARQVPA